MKNKENFEKIRFSKKNKLIAYAMDFVGFLIENQINLDKAILFGSVVTGKFDEESDVDIFLESNEKEDKIQRLLNEFDKTKKEKWILKGIENPISFKIGRLEKWPSLKRSIQSHGLLLYGGYKEIPENIESWVIFILKFNKLNRAKKVSIWRKMYGYSQKIGKKQYIKKGMIEALNGKRLEKGIIAMVSENSNEFKDFLNKNKINFRIIEMWSDSL